MAAEPVPFNKPFLTGREGEALVQALADGHLHGDGRFTRACQDRFAAALGSAAALMTPSCSLALDLAMLVAGIGPGDEVLVPDFTFVTTAQCVALRGATPVFCDIRADTLNLDESRLDEALTPATKAIIPVHYAGVCAEMDAINAFATRHGLMVVEDAAQAIGCSYRGRPAGSLGHMAAFSFHATKNVQCGEGGMLTINDPLLIDAATIAWEKGTDRRQFTEGRVDKYQWKTLGTSFVPSELNAAMLHVQFEETDAINERRRAIWTAYHDAFMAQEQRGVVRRPAVPEECLHNGHLYFLVLPDRDARNGLLRHLREAAITAAFHYVPLHATDGGKMFGRTGMEMTNAVGLPDRLIRLPLFTDLKEDQQQRVIEATLGFLERL